MMSIAFTILEGMYYIHTSNVCFVIQMREFGIAPSGTLKDLVINRSQGI